MRTYSLNNEQKAQILKDHSVAFYKTKYSLLSADGEVTNLSNMSDEEFKFWLGY